MGPAENYLQGMAQIGKASCPEYDKESIEIAPLQLWVLSEKKKM